MKSSRLLLLALAVLLVAPSGLNAAAVGTAFTYQGQLRDGGVPAGGTYNLQFKLYDAATVGSQVGGTLTLNGVVVTNGLFAVQLDFGTVVAGSARWLETAVNGTTLSPRQELKPVPNSMYASTAAVASLASAATGNSITSAMLAPDAASLNKVTAALMNVSANKVGIGTASPSYKLQVEDSTSGEMAVSIHNTDASGSERLYFGTSTGADACIVVWGSTGSLYPGLWRCINNKTGGSFDWLSGGQVRMTLTSAGSLGIGTPLPEESLSVSGALKVDQANNNAGTMDIKFGSGATGEGIGSKRTAGGNQNGLDFFTASNSRLNIANNGIVGVSGKLFVNQGDGPNNTAPNLVFGNSGSLEGIGSARWTGDNPDGLDFYTGGNKRMSITNAGNVGIGATMPSYPLTFPDVLGDKISLYGQSGDHHGFGVQANQFQIIAKGVGDSIAFGWGRSAAFNEVMRVTGGGDVGIRTLTPLSPLHVVGDVRASRFLDEDSTSYYLDPANVGTSLYIAGSIVALPGKGMTCNGQYTIGGTNLILRLGDSVADQVVLPSKDLYMGDTVSVVDGDQSIYFTDEANASANYIRWDDMSAYACGGTIGDLNSAFQWNILDNANTGWVFTNGTDVEFAVDDVGAMQIDFTLTQNGACDLAESFLGSADLDAGTVLVLDPALPEGVVASSQAYQKGIVGVVSTVPGILMGGPTADVYPVHKALSDVRASLRRTRAQLDLLMQVEALDAQPDPVDGEVAAAPAAPDLQAQLQVLDAQVAEMVQTKQDLEKQVDNWSRGNVSVALVGRVPVKVVGPVKAGDRLTTSDVPGFAMVMTQAGASLGIALGSLDAGEGVVVALIQPGWYGTPAALAAANNSNATAMTALQKENAELRARLDAVEARFASVLSRFEAAENGDARILGIMAYQSEVMP